MTGVQTCALRSHRDSNELRSVKLNNVAARTTSGIAAMEFVRHGGAIALLPDYAVAQGLESGELVEVLREWRELEDRPITALYPSREGMPARVRELIGFLRRGWGRRTFSEGLTDGVGGNLQAFRH